MNGSPGSSGDQSYRVRAGGSWASVWTDVRVWPERECGPGRPACTTQCRGLQCVPPCRPPVMRDEGAVTTPDGPHDPWDVGTAGYEAGCGPESCHCVQTLTPCSTGCGVWQVCAPGGQGARMMSQDVWPVEAPACMSPALAGRGEGSLLERRGGPWPVADTLPRGHADPSQVRPPPPGKRPPAQNTPSSLSSEPEPPE